MPLRIPAKIFTPSESATGGSVSNPAGIRHNDAETQFSGMVGNTPPDPYEFGDTLPEGWGKTEADNSESRFFFRLSDFSSDFSSDFGT